jgi:hypothetical protein
MLRKIAIDILEFSQLEKTRNVTNTLFKYSLLIGLIGGAFFLVAVFGTAEFPEVSDISNRSKLFANYSPWEVVSFQPLSNEIFESIFEDTGREVDPDNIQDIANSSSI